MFKVNGATKFALAVFLLSATATVAIRAMSNTPGQAAARTEFSNSAETVTPAKGSPVNATSEIIKVYSSGYQRSGAGANFSGWYEMCATPPEDGYTTEYVYFSLVGDRSCGAWSECRPVTQTPTKVCYDFRMQGHNEWGQHYVGPFVAHDGNGVGLSEGVLTIYWSK